VYYRSYFILVLVLTTFACQNSNSIHTETGHFANIWFSEYRLENNDYGQGTVTNYSQNVWYNEDPPNDFGWNYSWPDSGVYLVRAYPEVIYGKSPWAPDASTTTKIPILLSSSNLAIDFTTESKVTNNKYDFAFDVWLTNAKTFDISGSAVKGELMIWLNYNGGTIPPSDGTINGVDVTIDGEPYKLYVYQNFPDPNPTGHVPGLTWTLMAYTAQNQIYSGAVHLISFLNDLASRGLAQNNWYAASVELGTEVVYGTGSVKFTHYDIKAGILPGNVDTFEDSHDNKNMLGGIWYDFDDSGNGGNSFIAPGTTIPGATTNFTADNICTSGNAANGTYSIYVGYTHGAAYQYRCVGIGTLLSPMSTSTTEYAVDLSGYTTITFWAKGTKADGTAWPNAGQNYLPDAAVNVPGSIVLQIGSKNITDSCYYSYGFVPNTSWTKYTLTLGSNFTQPTWGT
jgi:hypothetical protein